MKLRFKKSDKNDAKALFQLTTSNTFLCLITKNQHEIGQLKKYDEFYFIFLALQNDAMTNWMIGLNIAVSIMSSANKN